MFSGPSLRNKDKAEHYLSKSYEDPLSRYHADDAILQKRLNEYEESDSIDVVQLCLEVHNGIIEDFGTSHHPKPDVNISNKLSQAEIELYTSVLHHARLTLWDVMTENDRFHFNNS